MGADEIVKIIEACGRNGVSNITFDNISINFMVESNPNNSVVSSQVPLTQTVQGQASTVPSGPSLQPRQLMMTAEEKLVLDEIRLGQLMIDDPDAYEQHMIDTHLERERDAYDG